MSTAVQRALTQSRWATSRALRCHPLQPSLSSTLSRWQSTTPPEPRLDTLHHKDTFHSQDHDPSHQQAVSNLLYNTPPTTSRKPHKRTLCALVTNEAGVLSRVSGCLAGRGVNIDSLVVSETETAGLSRMTIVLKGGSDVDQARKQLEDLVQVWAVVEFSPHAPVVERELLLVKLSILPPSSSSPPPSGPPTGNSTAWPAPASAYPTSPQQAMTTHIQRQAIVELTNLFQGRVLDLTPDFIMIELTGKSIKIDAFIELVRPFGIKELARSGVLAMLRGAVTGVGSKTKSEERKIDVDASQLPPG